MVARRGLLWFVLFALLMAQTLGLVHRMTHGTPLAMSAANAGYAAALDNVGPGDDENNRWATALAHGHSDDPTCLVFDQVSQGGAMFALPALLLPAAAPLLFLRWFQGEALARWAALFEARGPPVLR